MKYIYSPYAAKAIAEGRKRHMRFRVRGQGELPDEPFYENEWWYEILKPESTIPPVAWERLDVLKEAGVPIKGLVIAHEAPKLLTAPQEEKRHVNVSSDISDVVEAFAEILGVFLAVFGLLLVTAIRLDPALIAVLPDGSWLEVATWYDE